LTAALSFVAFIVITSFDNNENIYYLIIFYLFTIIILYQTNTFYAMLKASACSAIESTCAMRYKPITAICNLPRTSSIHCCGMTMGYGIIHKVLLLGTEASR